MKLVGKLLLSLVLSLACYAVYWAVRYRMPFGDPVFIDMRQSSADKACRVEFRASLASNLLGYPGHTYVMFLDPPDQVSVGFVPSAPRYQIPSLVSEVPGYLQQDSHRWNYENLNRLMLDVSPPAYAHAKETALEWDASTFQVGKRDCVTFANSIARVCGLRTPDPRYKYPQDYVAELKALNSNVRR